MKKSEKRQEPRHQSKLPVQFESGKGIIRDFSGSAVFIETDRAFSPGQPIEFTLALEYINPERPVNMKCRGEIIRIEKSDQKIGVVAAINSYTFEKFQK